MSSESFVTDVSKIEQSVGHYLFKVVCVADAKPQQSIEIGKILRDTAHKAGDGLVVRVTFGMGPAQVLPSLRAFGVLETYEGTNNRLMRGLTIYL